MKQDDWEKLPDVKPAPVVREPKKPNPLESYQREWEREEPYMWGALAAGAHGAAHAMEGPINGLIAGAKMAADVPAKDKPRSWDDIVGAYVKERDRIEREQAGNLKDFPRAPMVGAMMAGGVGSAPTTAGRLVLGGLEGGTYAAGSSKADLTKGEVAPFLRDTAIGTGLGVGAAGLGELAQIPGRALARRAGAISDATHAAELAAETDARQGAVASATGRVGGLTAAGMKAWDRLEDAMFNNAATEENKRWAQDFINSEEGRALYNQVLAHYAEDAPKMMGRITAAQAERQIAEAANNPEAIQQAASAAAEAKLGDTSGVTSRLAELARRNVPAMVGGAVAGPPGAAAGTLYSGMSGKQGTILSNMLKSPSAFIPLTKAAGVGIGAGSAMSHAAPPLAEWSRLLEPDDKEPQP